MSDHPALEVTDLEVTYERPVVSGFSLDIARGESVALMGPSGSGKSSILACVVGLQRPTSGRVIVDGQAMSDVRPGARARIRRKRIGVAYQDAGLLPELSVAENVAVTLLFDGVARDRALTMAHESLEAVGLGGHADKRTDEISGGQAQRVSVARALVRPSAALLVADEPTASLDEATARDIISLLEERVRATGVGALVATHDPAVAGACDRTLDLREHG
ncbi:ABC transporter ATP-binding protein [Kytococcus sedentarius]|uniref:ABC transporter ATP-binding protein n=1 Tax=Kytococcus sedentarius TaxID=1276 RepID=UPI0019527B3D|nr:ATP-binding cassette domain-containing protein [Kytococcus sedentarius]QRO87157.1 ATP-binding cassette domain-containing protein [Kytococcus sedentarius]